MTRPTAGSATRSRSSRPFLHAAQLAFVHPGTGASMQFEEPLPAELATVLDALPELDLDS